MRALTACLLVLALTSGTSLAQPNAAPLFHVPVSMKRELQALLDRYGTVRLDAAADYRDKPSEVLRMASGQKIVGGWNTRVPRIVIRGGVSDVRISSVRSDGWTAPDIEFTGGGDNNDIEIDGGNGGPGTQIRVLIGDGARINRLRLSEYGGLEVRQTAAGYVRDSTFTRLLGYWPGPQVAWYGNLREPSRGNAFLGIASITPGEGSVWRNAGDLWFVGWDCESWNGPGRGSTRCFSVEGATRLVSIGLSGGTAYPQLGGALLGVRDVPLFISWFQRGRGGKLDAADIVLDDVGTLVTVQAEGTTQVLDASTDFSANRLQLFAPAAALGGARVAPLDRSSAERQSALRVALTDSSWPRASRAKPVLRNAVDALGRDWRTGLQAHLDSSAAIQAAIDTNGVASLAPGVYYLDKPLKIGARGRVEGLLGDGSQRVVLVAKGEFAIIEGRGDFGRNDDGAIISLVLSGLTLQGGTHGIHWSGERGNLGPDAVVAWSEFSDLLFAEQSVAGVNVAGIGGLDSNLWRRTDFRDLPVAFRGDGTGVGPGMTYADKQHFVDCQYQRVSDTVWYWTSDRPSGGEVWSDNVYFNVGRLTRTRAANNLLWINSVMDGVHGDVAIDVTDSGATATYYFTMIDSLWRGAGPTVVTDTQSWRVGTLFVATEFAQLGGSIVATTGAQSLFAWGSRITGSAAVGAVQNGLFIDSRMGPFDQPLHVVAEGR